MKGAAQLLRRAQQRGQLDPERLNRYVGMIEQTANRLATLTDDLLDVSRLQNGALPLRLQQADLAALLRALAERLQEQSPGHRLVLEIEPSSCFAYIDPDRIEQVAENLIANAIKYTPDGGDIGVSLARAGDGISSASVTPGWAAGRARRSASSSRSGVPRTPSSATLKGSASDCISAVRSASSMVAACGPRVPVRGRGPPCGSGCLCPDASRTMSPVPPRNGRVLIVEDEDTISQIVAETLADEGYVVRRARNGREALEVLRGWCPQLILLDLMMPEMNGRIFHAELQKLDKRLAKVPIIILSGAREVRRRAAEIGAVEALSKPFDLNDVIDAVGRWVSPVQTEQP